MHDSSQILYGAQSYLAWNHFPISEVGYGTTGTPFYRVYLSNSIDTFMCQCVRLPMSQPVTRGLRGAKPSSEGDAGCVCDFGCMCKTYYFRPFTHLSHYLCALFFFHNNPSMIFVVLRRQQMNRFNRICATTEAPLGRRTAARIEAHTWCYRKLYMRYGWAITSVSGRLMSIHFVNW